MGTAKKRPTPKAAASKTARAPASAKVPALKKSPGKAPRGRAAPAALAPAVAPLHAGRKPAAARPGKAARPAGGRSGADPRGRRAAELEQRLHELDQHARQLERELSQQRAELAQSRAQLQAQQSKREELVADVERARNFDAASGLPNRAAFVQRLEQRLGELIRAGQVAAVLVVGIDRLSTLREALGFGTADQVAQRIGERLVEALAALQAPGLSRPGTAAAAAERAALTLVARVGDDEFALALAGMPAALDATAVARRLIEVVDGPMRVGGTDLRLMATVGVARLPGDGTRAETLLGNAQAALRFARERGTHNFEYFRVAIGQEGARRLRLEAELRRGLDQEEFTVHYQPRMRLRGLQIVGVEALLRWNHPERGLLAAGDFIDVAVDTGLITPIGESALRQACRDAAPWPARIGLSVNLSAREFRGARLEEIVDSALETSGLAPERLSVELAESSLHGEQFDIALVRLTALRERGVRLILDNYGVGYGGLDLLRRCRADYVKISPQLLAGLDVDADVFAVVRAIAALSRHLGASVIAQGIERQAQIEAALRAGCAEGQGYLLGRSVTAAGLRERLRAVRRG
jgi:predicted signal transduction protein with EAL and GGDEF domain